VRTDLASTLVREGEFTEPVKGLTVYAQSVDGKGNLRNLFINQVNPTGTTTIYTAEYGRITKQLGRPVLIMRNGSRQEPDERGVLGFGTFSEYGFDLSALTDPTELVHYKPSDRYLHELFFPDVQQDWEKQKKNQLAMLAEGHARLATPLYNIAFMALALSAIIGGGFSRLGYGKRIAVTGAVAAVVQILGFLALSASEDNAWINVLQYAVPLATIALALRNVFRQRVSRFIDMERRPAAIAVGAAA
jgi:lipopolysaccharide export system permease protein